MFLLRSFVLFLLVMVSTIGMNAQSAYFTKIEPSSIQLKEGANRSVLPPNYAVYQIDPGKLMGALMRAPQESQRNGIPFILELPMPNGSLVKLNVVEASVMHPELQSRYPMIRTFKGTNADGVYAHFGFSPEGFFASIFEEGVTEVVVQNYAEGDARYVMSYYFEDYRKYYGFDFHCGHEDEGDAHHHEPVAKAQERTAVVKLLKYDMALACTGNFGEAVGSKAGVMAKFAEAMTRMNAIYERDLAIRFQLVAKNDTLIFLDPDTDPYNWDGTGVSLLQQNQDVCDRYIGRANYDIGHVFTLQCTDIGGVASGNVCTGTTKGRGVTCIGNPNGANTIANTVRTILAHEVGHQFTASHTWDNCPDILQQRASGTAFEPGSGTTIMSYAGACGNQDVASTNDDYFHVGSLVQMYQWARELSSCAEEMLTDNNEPTIDFSYNNGFTIPAGTPFKLTATGADENSNSLTYVWEQYDSNPAPCELGKPSGLCPHFRSFKPSATGSTRYFPGLSNYLRGSSSPSEVIPTYTRSFKFMATVRDNATASGYARWKQMQFNVNATAGPFKVNTPAAGETWKQGDYREVTWDVANTDMAPVNCKKVNIYLWETNTNSALPPIANAYTLAVCVDNDGSHFVSIPEVTAKSTYRIVVEAADNIFFNVNPGNFTIAVADAPGFSFNPQPTECVTYCQPVSDVKIDLNSFALKGYANPLSLTVEGLPAGATFTVDKTTILPADGARVTIDFSKSKFGGVSNVVFKLSGPNANTIERTVSLNVVGNDFTGIAPVAPVNGKSGESQAPRLTWTKNANATTYEFELASSPTFGPSVIQTATGITDSFFNVTNQLAKSTLYYWRVRGANICGAGPWSKIYVFGTEVQSCSKQTNPTDVNFPVGTPTINSKITFSGAGDVSDVNVGPIKLNISPVRELIIFLVKGTDTVTLMEKPACGSAVMNGGFDDESPLTIPCPPSTGAYYKPFKPLSAFKGKPLAGEWTLFVRDAGGASSGTFTEWTLEVCSNSASNAPLRAVNTGLTVSALGQGTIGKDRLEATDADDAADKLQYVVVSAPAYGTLFLSGVALAAGQTFTQADINAGKLSYTNTSATTQDAFTFVVNDGKGGFFGADDFVITVQPTSAGNVYQLATRLFPNPAQQEVQLTWDATPISGKLLLEVIDIHGHLVQSARVNANAGQHTLQVGGLTSGVYQVKMTAGAYSATQKLVVQH